MRINPTAPTDWKDLQAQVARILTECGLVAEVEKTISTARGKVNIDVYAEDPRQVPQGTFLFECKHWSTPATKAVVHGFRTVVGDFGASVGILVSSAGFQKGAIEAAEFSNLKLVTWDDFEQMWQGRWIENYMRPMLYMQHELLFKYTEPLLMGNMVRKADALPVDRRQRFIEMRHDETKNAPAHLMLQLGAPWNALGNAEIILPLATHRPNWVAAGLPSEVGKTESLREVLEMLLHWAAEVGAEYDALFRNESAGA